MLLLPTLGFLLQIPDECLESLELDPAAPAQDQESAVVLRHRRHCYRNRRLKAEADAAIC
jgi:hypothetical protein